jgi:hypothetical protein
VGAIGMEYREEGSADMRGLYPRPWHFMFHLYYNQISSHVRKTEKTETEAERITDTEATR